MGTVIPTKPTNTGEHQKEMARHCTPITFPGMHGSNTRRCFVVFFFEPAYMQIKKLLFLGFRYKNSKISERYC